MRGLAPVTRWCFKQKVLSSSFEPVGALLLKMRAVAAVFMIGCAWQNASDNWRLFGEAGAKF
jgi:hypothetical protein